MNNINQFFFLTELTLINSSMFSEIFTVFTNEICTETYGHCCNYAKGPGSTKGGSGAEVTRGRSDSGAEVSEFPIVRYITLNIEVKR